MVRNIRHKLQVIDETMPAQSKESLLHKQILVSSVLCGEISKNIL